MALRRAILMKADTVVSLHADRLFSGRHAHAEKTPVVSTAPTRVLDEQLVNKNISGGINAGNPELG